MSSPMQSARDVWRLLPGPATRTVERAAGAAVGRLDKEAARLRSAVQDIVDRAVRAIGPAVVLAVLEEIDLTALVRERVDLDAVAEGIDVERIIDRVDIDQVVARADIRRVVDRLDLDAIVARVDLDGAVARVDLERVIRRVDIDAVAARLDLDAVVRRLDLIGLADYVVDGIDLPGIIRESSGSMASEVVRGVRMQGLDADEALSRAVSRLLPRRRGPRVQPQGPQVQ